jgi:hypothetical protein
LEHLARFLDAVVAAIADVDDLLLLGPGTVRDHLEHRLIETASPRVLADRRIVSEPAGRVTERQLVARLRHHLGQEPRRSTVGAYRWSGSMAHAPSGRLVGLPERVTEKRPRQR